VSPSERASESRLGRFLFVVDFVALLSFSSFIVRGAREERRE